MVGLSSWKQVELLFNDIRSYNVILVYIWFFTRKERLHELYRLIYRYPRLFQSAISNIANWKYQNKLSVEKCVEFGQWYKHYKREQMKHGKKCIQVNHQTLKNQIIHILFVYIGESTKILFFWFLTCSAEYHGSILKSL